MLKKYFKANKIRNIIGEYNALNIASYIQNRKLLSQHYSVKNPRNDNAFEGIVYMADGRFKHGGIADRIKGMVSLYSYCKRHQIPYRIYFCHPFQLSNYLLPNKYNWRIDDSSLSYNSTQSKAFVVKRANKDNYGYFEKRMNKNVEVGRQNHLYVNSMYDPEHFSQDFAELFRPSDIIEQNLDKNLKEIGGSYVSINFRFMQLLGDFKDQWGATLNEEEQEALISQCLDAIKIVKEKHPEVNRVLVAGDSIKFLTRAQKEFPYVYVVPGTVSHIDYTNKEEEDPNIKTFVDLLMIAHAQKAYFFARGDMFKTSAFAMVASMIGNIDFERL